MSEAYQPHGMRDVDAMVQEIASVLEPTFLINPWLCGVDVSKNTCVDDDLYSIACLPPNYPMPAIRCDVIIQPCAVWLYEQPTDTIERITYLAFDYNNSSYPIWG